MKKRAIVLGASSGIGKELAIQLTKEYKVGITGRRKELLLKLQKDYPLDMVVQVFDITQLNNPDELKKLTSQLGGLDLLVISSGTGKINEQLTFYEERLSIDTNVLAFTQIIDWAYSYFKENGVSGHIVGISSVAGIRGGRFAPAYNASKAYQINYLESIRHKSNFDRLPLIVTDIRPGFVDTAMGQAKNRFWLTSPENAATLIYRAIHKKRTKAYITGRWIWIALLLKIMPEAIFRKI